MKLTGLKLLVCAGLLLSAILIVIFLARHWNEQGEATLDTVPIALQWRVGSFQEYSFAIDSSSAMGMAGPSSQQMLTVYMEGVLQFRTLEVNPAEALIGMRLSSLDLEVGGGSPDEAILRELAMPFRVRFAPNGHLVGLEFASAASTDVRELIENLIRMFQVTVKQEDQWLAQESNALGRYSASYTRQSPAVIAKTKQYFIDTGGARSVSVAQVTSTESITLDPTQDWISAMSVDEVLTTTSSNGPASEVSNRASLELRNRRSVARQGASGWDFVATGAATSTRPDVTAQVKKLSLKQAEKEMYSRVSSLDGATGNRSGSIHRLRDLVMMDGQLPSMLLEKMRTEELTDRTRADLYLVLQLAGTPEAQAALNSVVTDPDLPVMNALRAIVALGAVTNPTEETLDTLWDTARSGTIDGDRRDLPATATLALGSLGSGLRATEDEKYTTLRADLLYGASSASDDRQRAIYLLALGNTADADPSMSRDLVTFLSDSSPGVRSAAANALGRLGTNEVGEELFKSFEQESSAMVRGSISEALVNWENPSPPAIASVRSAIQSESDEKARYNMAVLLGNTMNTFPENRAVLENLLTTEPSKRIRQQVANSIYGDR